MRNLLCRLRVRLTNLPQIIGGGRELCEWAVDNGDCEALLISASLSPAFNGFSQMGFGCSGHVCLVLMNREREADGLCFLPGLLSFRLALHLRCGIFLWHGEVPCPGLRAMWGNCPCLESRASRSSSVPSKRTGGSGCKVKYRQPLLNIGKLFYAEDDQILEQVA